MPGNERGGRKPGAGRKPGRRPDGLLLAPGAPSDSNYDAQESAVWAEVPLKFRAPLMLLARGRSANSIANELGIDRTVVGDLPRRYPAAANEAIAQVVGMSPRQAFGPLAPHALGAYHDIVTSPEHPDRLSAARDIAAYVYDKPVTRAIIQQSTPPTIIIMDQAQLTEPEPEAANWRLSQIAEPASADDIPPTP